MIERDEIFWRAERRTKQERDMNTKKAAIIAVCLMAGLMVMAGHGRAQQAPSKGTPAAATAASAHDGMGGMDMSGMRDGNTAEATSANSAMSGHHMDMGAHMFMTELRPENAADEKRAEDILEALRPAIAKYKDYNVALAEGFKIFHPEIPQEHYHFTNYAYAFEAQFKFDPTKPTSLLYKKTATGYELEGAMYTAPKRATEDELNERVPLSVARWHKHVNFCLPPKGTPIDAVNRKTFGLDGSIAAPEACEAAGGRWIPQVFGWMVHVYPWESEPEKIWAH
jgi:hypothetical protein